MARRDTRWHVRPARGRNCGATEACVGSDMLAKWLDLVGRAISRARVPILLAALTYLFSVAAGIVMVTTGNGFSLR